MTRAVALLEPVAWKNPGSGLVSSLQGAYMNVKIEGWLPKKREELVARHAAKVASSGRVRVAQTALTAIIVRWSGAKS